MILMDPASRCTGALTAEQIEQGRTAIVDRNYPKGRYLVLSIEGRFQRLLFRNYNSSHGVTCSVLTGPDFALRLAVLNSFNQALSGAGSGSSQICLMPTPFQQGRLNLMLRIIDYLNQEPARQAPVREVARRIVYPHSHFANAAEWKASSERRRTQRLIDEAKALTEGGYLSLLHGKMPKTNLL